MIQKDFSRALSFNSAAQLYERARPDYPPEIFAKIASVCNPEPDDLVLEIGAGTGKATRKVAEFGCHITVIEPGRKMIEELQRVCSGLKNLSFFNGKFDSFGSEKLFKLIYCAHAFHWLDRKTSYKNCSKYLVDGGHLALFWNFRERITGEMGEKMSLVYDRFLAPDERRPFFPSDPLSQFNQEVAEFEKAGVFKTVALERYPFTIEYSPEGYRELLLSYSDTMSLGSRVNDFLEGIQEAIGGNKTVPVKYYSSIIIGRK